MRKVHVAVVTALAVLGIAAVAFASTNTYTLKGTVSPSKAGTTKKPAPVSVTFNATIGGAGGLRPTAVTAYEISVGDGVINQKPFASCKASAATCSASSLIGSATVEAVAGKASDHTDKALPCHLDAKIYNGPAGHAILKVKGVQPTCAIPVDQTIDASFKKVGKKVVIKFAVPDSLVHPLGPSSDVETGTMSLKGSIKKLTKKVKGKKVALIASTACPGGKHAVSVKFTTLDGTDTASTTVPCKK